MSFNPATVAAFTGHRTYTAQATIALHITITTLHARGVRSFLCGMAIGFDLAAAEAVIACRRQLSDVRLVAIIPFEGQQARFSTADQVRFEQILAAADEVITLAPSYFSGCYQRRNDFLVEHASVVVAWYNGSASGTHYTVRRAQRLGREVINLHPQLAQEQVLF